nr:hypothetical protein [Bacteroidota bacterium]
MNWIGLIIITIVSTGFLVLAMSLKLLFGEEDEINMPSCHLDEKNESDSSVCGHCKVKAIIDCKEKPALK